MDTIAVLLAVIVSGVTAFWTWRYAALTRDLKELAIKEQKASFDRWLAVNKPFLIISFPDNLKSDSGVLYDKKAAGAPLLIRYRNRGEIPCKLLQTCLGEFQIEGTLECTSITKNKVAGKFQGTYLVPGEWKVFQSIDVKNAAIKYANKARVFLAVVYEYEPDKTETLIYSVFSEQLPGNSYADLVIDESTRKVYPGNRINSCGDLDLSEPSTV